jgi:hypothetical protein
MEIGFLLAGLAAIFVGKMLTKTTLPDELTIDRGWGGASNPMDASVVYSPLSQQIIDGHAITNGEASHVLIRHDKNGQPYEEVLNTHGYVELHAKTGDAPYRASNVARGTDQARARNTLMAGQLELYDTRMLLEIPETQDPMQAAWRLIALARCLSDGDGWADWLADPRPDYRFERTTLLLRDLPTCPQALAVARRCQGAPDAELSARAALVLNDAEAMLGALTHEHTPAFLWAPLFNARLEHGVAGFESVIGSALFSEDETLFKSALKASAELPPGWASAALSQAYDKPNGPHRMVLLETLAQRDPEAAAQRALAGLDAADDIFAHRSAQVLARCLDPETLTARVLPLIESGDSDLHSALCHALSLNGTIDAVWPLRQLQDTASRALRQRLDEAIAAIQARHDGPRGGLALTDAAAGTLALSDEHG